MPESNLKGGFDFIKLACGQQDFLLWDLIDQLVQPVPEDYQEAARQVCPRRTGVGASGLLVLRIHEREVEVQLYQPGRPDPTPNHPALLCAAKYLLDGARYGRTVFTFSVGKRLCRVHPIDSRSMAVDLEFASSRDRPVTSAEELRSRSFTEGKWSLQGVHLEGQGQKALLFFQPELELSHLPRWKRAVFRLRRSTYLPVVVQLASPRLLNLEYRPTDHDPDTVVLASLAAQAAYLNGLIDENVVVRLHDHPYFVRVDPLRRQNRVMVPIRYVFRGSYSFAEYNF